MPGLERLRIDITPLRQSRDLRLLFTSRTVTLLGSAASEVAMLLQVKQLTNSPSACSACSAWRSWSRC